MKNLEEPGQLKIEPAAGFQWVTYVLLTVTVHCLILLAPSVFPVFRGAAHTTAFLLASLVLALLGMFWPDLRPRHLRVILAALIIIEPPLYFGFAHFFPEQAGDIAYDRTQHGAIDLVRSIGVQLFISLVMSMGLWMRTRYDVFSLRRSGTDREEREKLFELKQSQLPEDGLTYLRYVKLMECGITLIGERMMRMRGVLNAFQRDELLFIYDLMNVPGEPECRRELLELAMQRREFQQATLGRVYLVGNDDPDTIALLKEFGFRHLGPHERDAEIMFQIRQRIGLVLRDEFKEWRPFSDIGDYYFQSPEVGKRYETPWTEPAA